MSKLKVIAGLLVKSKFRDEVLEVLHKVIDASRKEEGNISYILHEDIKNPLKFTILEEWKSQEAIDFHNQTAHYAFLKEIGEKVENINVEVIKEVY